ncbi:MAG: hypothetical protein IJC98_06095 [Clostridia bacterium]|nr:hypothetical protein [Clostridia bacterium]
MKKRSMGLGLFAFGILFLCNPNVNVIDVLPDVFGWLLIALSMTTFAYINEDMANARRLAWILCLVSTIKLWPMYCSLQGEKAFPLMAEPTMVLVFACCFGALEMVMGIMILRTWISSVSYFGLMSNSTVAIRGDGGLHFITVYFLIARAVGSVLPELVYLRTTEYLSDVVYGVVIDIRDYRPYLIVLCAAAVLYAGIGFCILFFRYLRRLSKDSLHAEAYLRLTEENEDKITNKGTMERIRIAFFLMMLGGVFLCYFSVDFVNILPDFVGLLLLAAAVFLLRKKLCVSKSLPLLFGGGALISAVYYGVRWWHSHEHATMWADNYTDYFNRTIAISVEHQTRLMQLQLIMVLCSVIETAIVCFLFYRFLKTVDGIQTINAHDAHNVYDSMPTEYQSLEKLHFAKQLKHCFVWLCISVGFELLHTLPMFSFVISPFPMIHIVINGVFLCIFYRYLMSRFQVAEYHYRYHGDKQSDPKTS